MYDNNPTLEGIKTIYEDRQGEAFYQKQHFGNPNGKLFYIESYGCAMNFSDSEIVATVLGEIGYDPTRNMDEADLILINTCSIRDKAEETVRKRLYIFAKAKRAKPSIKVGILGCMAERLKKTWLEDEKLVDLVVGPDAYRDLPNLLGATEVGERSINVLLSRDETYSDISPTRLNSDGVTAFVSITRGCDNMCSFCVVPFTRGRERSREAFSIVAEAQDLFDRGYREVTLLGQNVDSYKFQNPENQEVTTFAMLLDMVARIHPDLRVRFSTSHPKDIDDEVLHTIVRHENICNYIHLPVQSGNSRILELMNRTYTREWYIDKINRIYELIPDCAISSDMITGFCSETEEEHQETLSIMEIARYTYAYMYYYSERPGTLAARKYADDIPLEVKNRRLDEVVRMMRHLALESNKKDLNQTYKVLIEGDSKKSDQEFKGRNSQNKMLVFPKKDGLKKGDYCMVHVTHVNSATLIGEVVS